eukprot:gene4639-5796_t
MDHPSAPPSSALVNDNINEVENNNNPVINNVENKKLKAKKEKKQKPKLDFTQPLKESPTPQDIENHNDCLFWSVNKKKHRAGFCKFKRRNGSKYCTHHIPLDEFNNNINSNNNENSTTTTTTTVKPERKRVSCPLNPSHIVYEDNLSKHLKGCPNSRPTQKEAHIQASKLESFYKKNNNNLVSNEKLELTPIQQLSKVENQVLEQISLKLDQIFSNLYPNGIPISNHTHSSFDKIFDSTRTLKHIQQESSMISILEMNQLLSEKNLYLEYGAGSGKLSQHIFSVLEKRSGHILIDRMKFRSLKKVDRLIKNEKSCLYFQRLLIDIRDLDLGQIDILKKNDFVVTSKHLCGCATDFTLESIYNVIQSDPNIKNHFKGIGIATCCHHVCNWDTYINQQFIKENLKLSPQEFQLICSISSWATINEKKRDREEYEGGGGGEVDDDEDDDENKRESKTKNGLIENDEIYVFSKERKEELGYKAKRILDYGRYLFVKDKLGLETRLDIYTNHSKENLFLSGKFN